MQRILLLVLTLILISGTQAQYSGLTEGKAHSVKLYYSNGQQARANSIVQRVDDAMVYYSQMLNFKPDVTLLVLTQKDWSTHTDFPVYGMPHFKDEKVLVVAAENNALWKSFIPPLEQLPQDLRSPIATTYKGADGALSMEPFFDLLALHELGHAFHLQAGLNMQRKWMGELFVNVLLHTYIAEKEPASLPALTLFPRMVIAGGTKDYQFTSLQEVHDKYEEIGKRHPKNYGWYQSRWHAAAATIYNKDGKGAGRKLWDALKAQKENVNDAALLSILQAAGVPAVADMIQNWDKDTVR